MADPEWDLGKPGLKVTLAMPGSASGDDTDRLGEIFRVQNFQFGSMIRAVRPLDHIDLTFQFRGLTCINLESPETQPQLAKISRVLRRKIRVIFPSQHIAEQIKEKPYGIGACESAAAWGAMRVRMSQPSRLVFAIPDKIVWAPPLRLINLTDWSRLTPVINRRAGVGMDLAAQLASAFPGLTPAQLEGLTLAEAEALIAAGLEGPGEGETALEMPGRLILSPSQAGRWIVPGDLPSRGATPLWTARLDRAGRASVRAIWSSRLEPGRIPLNLDEPTEAGGQTLSLSRENHWEIVAQTSVYGLAAMRRLAFKTGQVLPQPHPEDTASAPRPTVVRPAAPIRFLNEIDKKNELPNQDSGIALATPFEDADMSTSALGGFAALSWRGDPPSIFRSPKDNCSKYDLTNVSLERLSYRGYLGRDTEVVAVDKAFFFPLGGLTSIVTVHERAIYPDYAGNPVSYLIRRSFLTTPGRPRSYPGPYQPFDGRDFPPSRVEIKTLRTPDLAPIVNIPLRLPDESKPIPEQSVFWPQIVECSEDPIEARNGIKVSDVLFEWSTEDAASVRSKLIVVKSNVIGRQDVMRALIDYYNGEVDHRRTAWLGGARHRYAEPDREGDTSFDTTRWLLSAQGRRDGIGGAEHFALDGRMEGADQPPFYPFMESGFVSMQNIEQMLGVPHGQVEVRYFDEYKRDGLKTKHQIFLTLGASPLAFRASSRSERSGGIATPDVNVAAISRLVGPVGGSVERTLDGAPNFASAVAGNFDPKQFFGDAKLLGVVSLAEIVEVAGSALSLDRAPQLIDETLLGARNDLEVVKEVVRGLREALYGPKGTSGLVAQLEVGIAKANAVLEASDLKLDEVYPSLTNALAPFRGSPADVETLLKSVISKKKDEIRDPIAKLVPKFRALRDSVADVIKDPVPDAFEHVIKLVQQIFDAIFKTAEEQIDDFAKLARSLLEEWLKNSFCGAVDTEGFGTILFAERGALSCVDIFADPPAAIRAFSDGLYGAVFEQLQLSLVSVLALEDDTHARLDLELDRYLDTIRFTLHAGIALISDRLAALDPAVDDIRDQQRQAQFVSSVAGDLRPRLKPASVTTTPQEALAFANNVATDFPRAARQSIDSRLVGLLSAIHPVPNVDRQVLLDEMSILVRQLLEDRLIGPLAQEATGLADRLTRLITGAAHSGFTRLLAIVGFLFDALLKSDEIAVIASAGRAAQGVCNAVGDAAKLIGHGVMAATADLDSAAQKIVTEARRIQPPPGPPGLPLRSAVASLTTSANSIIEACHLVDVERQSLTKISATICAETKAYLDPLSAIIRLRRSVTTTLIEVARQSETIENIFADSQPSPGDRAALRQVTEQCAALSLSATGIAEMRTQPTILKSAIESIETAGLGSKGYRERVRATATELTELAVKLSSELSGGVTPSRLRELMDGGVRDFQDLFDRRLTGFLLQSVGLTPATLDAIRQAVTKAVTPFVAVLVPIYNSVEVVLKEIVDLSPADSTTLRKVYKLALGGDAKIQALEDARRDLTKERSNVQAIFQKPDLAKVEDLINSYRDGSGALTKASIAVDSLDLIDVGQRLTEALREELKKIEEEVSVLMLQLVPTKFQTRYFWQTQLKPYRTIFDPGRAEMGTPAGVPPPPRPHPAEDESKVPWHLWIDGRFSFDVVTGKREMEVLGVLRPFSLSLLGADFDMLTIKFEETRFTSVNGGKPDFTIKVSNVTIGTYLKFVETLQQWLTPEGSGLYLRPTDGYPGVEVGYIYDAGMIQIGSLQFINVAFRIAAQLPFSSDHVSKGKAKFVFALAGPERPFLISCPPYGGGGWVSITCTSDRVEKVDLAFVFGGVAAIKFGPLNAQGRIVAIVQVQSRTVEEDKDEDKQAYIISAIFEAAGEGCIACFSISVMIRVALTQTSEGALFGETTFRFSFKVGFARLTYSVSARYRLSNRSDPQAAPALASLGFGRIHTIVPIKETEWQAYRRYFDLDLLEAA